MENPVQIYDITDIPHFPFEPGLLAWASLTLLTIITFLIIKFFISKQKRYKKFEAFNLFDKELKNIDKDFNNNLNIKDIVFRASLITRRLVSCLEPYDITTMSENELSQFKNNISSDALKDLLSNIQAFEKIKYQEKINHEQVKKLFENVSYSSHQYKTVKLQDLSK